MLSLTGELTLFSSGRWVQAIVGLGLQWLRIPQLIKVHVGLSLSLFTAQYHYYGIAVKESSQYYDVMYSKKGAAWVSETGKKEVSKQTVAYSPRSKLGTLLPEFPNVKDLNLPASLPEEKVSTPAGLLEWVVSVCLSQSHHTHTHHIHTNHNHTHTPHNHTHHIHTHHNHTHTHHNHTHHNHTHTPQPHTQHTYTTHTHTPYSHTSLIHATLTYTTLTHTTPTYTTLIHFWLQNSEFKSIRIEI